jgi:hypothetical protein
VSSQSAPRAACESIFREASRRIADCAQQFCVDVSAAADKIDHLLRDRIIKHSVDGEIAARASSSGEEKWTALGCLPSM